MLWRRGFRSLTQPPFIWRGLVEPLLARSLQSMDLLRACDEMKGFIETAQKLVEKWEEDPDNYSQLEEGLTAMKAELDKFKD